MLRVVLLAATVLASAFAAGCTDKLSFSSATLDEPSFEVEPERGDASTLFRVDAGALGKYNVSWDFGDGTVAYGPSAEHRYGFTNGAMTITLIATDESGKQGIATRVVTLGNGNNAKPSVSLSTGKTWVQTGSTVPFLANARDADPDPLRFIWKIKPAGGMEKVVADGPAGLNHTFDATGSYVVSVEVRDPKGGTASASQVFWATKTIPATAYDAQYFGNLTGAGGAGLSEKAYTVSEGAANQSVDSAVFEYKLDYSGFTIVLLTWNDTSGAGAQDLDLELRHAGNQTTIWKSERHTVTVDPANPPPVPPPVPPGVPVPAGPFEFNMSLQPPGEYQVVVRSYTAAQVAYRLVIHSNLVVTPEIVAKAEGGA